jgi:parallel beta-helix repeat protein
MSADTTPTNVSLIQRDANGNNQWVDLLGGDNPNKAIGFDVDGIVAPLDVPLLSAENTFTEDQAIDGKLNVHAIIGADVQISGTNIDWMVGTSYRKTLSANTTFTFTHDQHGQEITVAITNTASNYTVTWPAGIVWPNDVVPVQSIGATTTVYTFRKIDGVIYGSTSGGSLPFTVVKTWAQMQQALTQAGTAGGGVIYVDGTIIVPPNNFGGGSGLGGLNINVPNVVLTGPANGASVIKLQAGSTYTSQIFYTININVSNVIVENITIEGVQITHTFNSVTRQRNAVGIHLARGPVNPELNGISDTTIRNTTILKMFRGIWLSGSPTSGVNRNLAILNNKIRQCGAGIYLEYSLDGLLIDGNSIIGDGAVYDGNKFSGENAIWVGLGIFRGRITNNHCADHQRMGIEVFWPFRNTFGGTNTVASRGESAAGFVVANNTVHNTGTMGISFAGARGSVVANNTITDATWIGLEIVGDDRNTQTQRPDLVVNATAVGNMIKNVRGTPRRKKATLPADTWLYGYSPIELDPTNCTLPSQAFSNRVPLTTQHPYTTGSKTFVLTTPKVYPEFAVGKEVRLRRATDGQNMFGTVTANDGTEITVNVTSLSAGSDATLYTFTLCPYGLHTISVPSLQLDWSASNGNQNGVEQGLETKGTPLLIRSTVANDQFLSGVLASYVVGATTADIRITNSGVAFEENTSWIAMLNQQVIGFSIDQIDGCKAIGNTVDITLDTSSSIKYGCQIQSCDNISFENNFISRAGTRYLFLNNSNRVVMRGNMLKAGSVVMERAAVNLNITKLGEDTSFVEDTTAVGSVARPTSLYAIFGANSPGYNAGLPYNNSKIIFHNNTVLPSTQNAIRTLTNGAAIFSDQYSRPESRFGTSVVLKNNWVNDGFTSVVDFAVPVLDYSQKWSSTSQEFTAYRFHVDTNQSGSSSRILDVAAGSDATVYQQTYTSVTSHTLVVTPFVPPSTGTSKAFVIDNTTGMRDRFVSGVNSGAIANGVFVRATALSGSTVVGFVEGRVNTVNAGTFAFSMYATYSEGTAGTYTSWRIVFDTSALFVDKLSRLNLRKDVVLDYHTGSKIGTSPEQKIGFWNKAPVAQPAAVADATSGSEAVDQLNALLARLRSIGIIAE